MEKLAAKEICFWTEHARPSEPHEENIPWMFTLRNQTVTLWHLVYHYGDEYRL